jgi:hypothetical protein
MKTSKALAFLLAGCGLFAATLSAQTRPAGTPAIPATPATPATVATPAVRATPATPAQPPVVRPVRRGDDRTHAARIEAARIKAARIKAAREGAADDDRRRHHGRRPGDAR